MFLASDTIERRHSKIRSFLPNEPVIAIILAAIDFEWTIRRAIIALGSNNNRHIRDNILSKCSGIDAYKEAWKKEVKPRFGTDLSAVLPNWAILHTEAYQLRHRVIHGLRGMPSTNKAQACVDEFLLASQAVTEYASLHNISLCGKRLPIRRKKNMNTTINDAT